MAKYKVILEREECIACEGCIGACSDYFEMADDDWAQITGSTRVGSNDELETDDLGCIRDAADTCPVNIIHIYEGGNKII
jgi:ferredoxin